MPEATVALDATQARPRTELVYVVDGAARWQAVYQVVLWEARCQVSGAATIASQTLRVDTAEVQLVAGSINRARPEAPAPQAFRAKGLALEERSFTVDEARTAQEAFVTSASQVVLPVVRIDGQAIGGGKPGPVATALRREFHRHAEFS